MGYDLIGEKSDFRFHISQWPVCLKLAKAFGWKPIGTSDPYEGQSWSGDDYLSNAGQLVAKKDALQMASALELAVEAAKSDVSGLSEEQQGVVGRITEDSGDDIVLVDVDDLATMVKAAFAGEGTVSPAKILAFIQFCSEGEFRIM